MDEGWAVINDGENELHLKNDAMIPSKRLEDDFR